MQQRRFVMIELIYNEEGVTTAEEKALTEPKNVKQIGDPGAVKKIFLEDFVHTFLWQSAKAETDRQCFGILLGESESSGGRRNIYVQSALTIPHISEKQGKYLFTEKVWGQVYQDCQQYFPNQEIIGWFLSCPGFAVQKDPVIEETHRTYFSGAEKVLFMMEPLERESAFFAFDGSRFEKQSGYYIYYEKNEPMQTYMADQPTSVKTEGAEERADAAIAHFRKLLREKEERKVRRKRKAVSYGTRAAAVMGVLIAAAVWNGQRDAREPVQVKETTAQQTMTEEVIVEELPGAIEEVPETVAEEPIPEEAILEETEETDSEEAFAEQITYVEYVVQAGDTLAKISREHYGTADRVEEICSLNEISNGDYIQAGEIILLP